jgi:acyl phosphate:glycerol-3-phosphate acyltransferase
MEIVYIVLGIILAYLIGSIPTAVWFGIGFFNTDVRQHGSGNSGATNTFRVLGTKAGSIVMAVDIFKGWTATAIVDILAMLGYISPEYIITFKLIFGIIAVTGHIFPIYVNFKGGKGVATLLGMGFSIHPEAALLCILVFLLVLFTSKYVSLGSIIAALSFPLMLLLPELKPNEPILIIFGFIFFAIVVLTHHKNIRRIMNGEENKAKIRIKLK